MKYPMMEYTQENKGSFQDQVDVDPYIFWQIKLLSHLGQVDSQFPATGAEQ